MSQSPFNYDAAWKKVETAFSQGKPKTAAEEIEKIYKAYPSLRNERIDAHVQAMDRDVVAAKQQLEESFLRRKDVDYEVAYQSGLKFLAGKKYDEAILAFQDVLQVYPESVEAQFLLKKATFERECALLTEEQTQKETDRVSRDEGNRSYPVTAESEISGP
jgi:TolA-binding protein